MTGSDHLIRWLTRLLLGFALVSVGVVWGKAMIRRQLAVAAVAAPVTTPLAVGPSTTSAVAATASATNRPERAVQVYYVHTTLRCATCNAIERQASDALRSRFAPELARGALSWHTKNFQQDDAFARRYGIVSSCVLVVARAGDQEIGFKRLDEVWTLVDEPAAFENCVRTAVRAWLPAEQGKPD